MKDSFQETENDVEKGSSSDANKQDDPVSSDQAASNGGVEQAVSDKSVASDAKEDDVAGQSEPMSEQGTDKTDDISESSFEDSAIVEETEEPKWYIIQTLTGQEGKVKMRIDSTIEELGLQNRVLRVLVPEEETIEIKGEKRVERKRKMYPGYVFVEMVLDDDVWYKIRSTTGVARFIGGKMSPVPVTDREMQRVLRQLGIKEKEITVEFAVGEPIRIISGSFIGNTGYVSEINAPKSKLKAMINIFGRDTSVEVDFDRIEKVV